MNDTMKEIKRIADFAIDNKNADQQHLRKALINIANLAHAEIAAGELPIGGR